MNEDANAEAPGGVGEGDTDAAGHVPVLVEQVLGLLAPQAGQVVLDCTVGLAGHATRIAPLLAPGGRYVGLDLDPANVALARERLDSVAVGSDVEADLIQANFTTARAVLDELGIDRVDGVLADLGFASNQMGDPQRGLSFNSDGPLDMRLDPTLTETAADLIAGLDETELANLLYRYGDERRSRRIARKIVEHRRRSPINTTGELAALVRAAYASVRGRSKPSSRKRRAGPKRIDPATRTFMALRIAVNRELESLEALLASLGELMRPGGVAAVISFHSHEDRMVKRAFMGWHREGRGERLTAKPVVAEESERLSNPRSRSAKLRAIRWLGATAAGEAGEAGEAGGLGGR